MISSDVISQLKSRFESENKIAQPKSRLEKAYGRGFSNTFEKLSTDKISGHMRNACFATAAHKVEEKWFKPFGFTAIAPDTMNVDLHKLPGNIEARSNCFQDRKNGLKMVILSDNTDEVVISMGALGSISSELPNKKRRTTLRILIKNVFFNLLGFKPKVYGQAEELFIALKDTPELRGKKITLVGHCLGGSIAEYVALRQNVKAETYNSFPLGSGLQKKIGKDNLDQANNLITHISIDKDLVSDFPCYGVISRITNFIGLRIPQNFGIKYRAATHYSHPSKVHNFFVGTFMKQSGYSERTLPQDWI